MANVRDVAVSLFDHRRIVCMAGHADLEDDRCWTVEWGPFNSTIELV